MTVSIAPAEKTAARQKHSIRRFDFDRFRRLGRVGGRLDSSKSSRSNDESHRTLLRSVVRVRRNSLNLVSSIMFVGRRDNLVGLNPLTLSKENDRVEFVFVGPQLIDAPYSFLFVTVPNI